MWLPQSIFRRSFAARTCRGGGCAILIQSSRDAIADDARGRSLARRARRSTCRGRHGNLSASGSMFHVQQALKQQPACILH